MKSIKLIGLIFAFTIITVFYQNCSDPFESHNQGFYTSASNSEQGADPSPQPLEPDPPLQDEDPDSEEPEQPPSDEPTSDDPEDTDPTEDEEPANDEEPSDKRSGMFIENDDWLGQKKYTTFGDHSKDPGFVSSQPGDNDSIKVVVKKGSHYGSGLYYLMPDRTEEAWVTYCMRFSQSWTASVGGKLPGFGGHSSPTNGGQGGNPSTGNNAWSARMLYGIFDQAKNSVPLGLYVYHTAQSKNSIYGDPEWWAPAPSRLHSQASRVPQNRWDTIKQRIKVNSPGKSDGVIEAWHNGKKVYSRSDFNFTNNEQFREVYKFWLNVYYGGGATPSTDHVMYFDQINYSVGEKDGTSANCTN